MVSACESSPGLDNCAAGQHLPAVWRHSQAIRWYNLRRLASESLMSNMSTLRQSCPSCNRQLELPISALGRLAKCPACEAVFTVTVSTDGNVVHGQLPTAPPPPPTNSVQPPPAPAAHADSPTFGSNSQYEAPQTGSGATSPVYCDANRDANRDANPFSSPLDEGMAAHTPASPYVRPDYAADPVAEVGALQITQRRIEEVFTMSLAIFGDRCGLLILAFLLSLFASFVVLIAPILILQIIDDAGGTAVATIGALVLSPILIFFSCYLSVGLAGVAIAVARNSPAPMSELMPPMGNVVRFLVGAAVIAVVVAVVGILIAGLMSVVSLTGNNGLMTVMTVLVFFAGVVLSMMAGWLFWSWPFIVSDGKGTAIGSMRAAISLTMHNKATSILLVVVACVLAIVGTTFCYVGHLITAPLTMLLFAVAYLLMTNQEVPDPRIARQNYQQLPL